MDTNTSFDHRIHSLEEARDRLTKEIERLRDVIGIHESRLVASETMQPVILRTLEEIRTAVTSSNAVWGRLAWLLGSTFLLGLVYWVFQGGLVLPPKV